ncbi:MAG: AAA family ATPase [Solobacterium sp.]|nr:AAA family ATPase [Solobacterium sp.]MCH4206340.1 AAA family ATPase [Solobacterium sp.]MCH4227842.1 AAA family ATPase [Solobacterium sp.]MCH4283200.1 AAA family ATPase [Solobacterium sp.]
MRLEKLHIKGFRNFDDTEISFRKKTLIIGANDVGKTNLLYALRILFDKTLSEHDLELSESDYNAYTGADEIEITAELCEVTEDCLLSTFSGALKDGKTVIRYTNQKNGSYKISNGFDVATLSELPTRVYIRKLNMEYVDTNRNMFSFLNHERVKMLQLSKEKLSHEDTVADDEKTKEIQRRLDDINKDISSLQYVSKSLEQVNKELGELSVHNEDQTVHYVAGESNADKLLNNLVLEYSTGDKSLAIGGDGRNNQIFLSTWIAKQHIQESIDHVTFYAIEEPEAHLHPHQQRKLASYIKDNFHNQILVTTHSPQIVSQFNPENIVRLYAQNKCSIAACGGCSFKLQNVFSKFSYRLNALSAEIFFSDGVFLVEGVSEVLFYSAVAKELNLDLDRNNISILSVEGIGFKPYVAICNALKIPWVLRTDNDIFLKSTKNTNTYYYAGISRIIGIISELLDESDDVINYWKNHSNENEWAINDDIPEDAKQLNEYIRTNVKKFGIYLSDIDLENDMMNSKLNETLKSHYNINDSEGLVKAMKKKKAENMVNFLDECHTKLPVIKNSDILEPLNTLIVKTSEKARPIYDESTN